MHERRIARVRARRAVGDPHVHVTASCWCHTYFVFVQLVADVATDASFALQREEAQEPMAHTR